MVVKIYGLRQSTCTQRVSIVLKELGIAYEIVPVDFAANEQKSEEYLQSKNPFGQIPVLVRLQSSLMWWFMLILPARKMKTVSSSSKAGRSHVTSLRSTGTAGYCLRT